MWFKCEEKSPSKNGTYFVVHRINAHNIYGAARFAKNLGKVIGLSEYEGQSGFYDSDSEWGGAFVTYPTAWKYIERYEG